MIEIPEEGLTIWICKHNSIYMSLNHLATPPLECFFQVGTPDKPLCSYEPSKKPQPCNTQAYRIVRVKP